MTVTKVTKKRLGTRPPRTGSRLPPDETEFIMSLYHGQSNKSTRQNTTMEAVNGSLQAQYSSAATAQGGDLMDIDSEDLAEATERQQQEILIKSRPFKGKMVDSKDMFEPLDYSGNYDYFADTWELKALQYQNNRNPSPPKFTPPPKKNENSALARKFMLNALNPPYLKGPRERYMATTMLWRAQQDTQRVANLYPYRYYVGGSSDFIDLDWHPDNVRFALSAICSNDAYNRPGNFCFGNIREDTAISISMHARWKESGKPFIEATDGRPDPALHQFYTVGDVKFVNGGNFFTTCGWDGNVKIWNTETLNCTHTFSTFAGKGKNERMATMNPHSPLLAIMTLPEDQNLLGPVPLVRVSDEGRAKLVGRFRPDGKKNLKPDSLTFAGEDLVVGYRGVFNNTQTWGYIALFDSKTMQQKSKWKDSATAHQDVFYHPGGWVVAAASMRKGENSPETRQMVRVMDTRSPNPAFEAYIPQYDINKVTMSPCGTYITASCTDSSTIVWDWRIEERVLVELKHEANPLYIDLPDSEREDKDTGVNIALWQNSDMLITGGSDGAINRWNMRRPYDAPETLADMGNCIMSAKFSANMEHLVVGDAGGHALVLNPRGVDGPNDEDADLPEHPVFGAKNALRNIRRFKMSHATGKQA